MCSKSATYRRWRTAALNALFATVFFLKFTAASHTETNQHGVSGEGNIGDELKETLLKMKETEDELKKELSKLPEVELEGLVQYYKDRKIDVPKKEPQGNGEALIWKLLFYGFARTAQRSLIQTLLDFVLTRQAEYSCYDGLGCFNPSNRMALDIGGPVSPRKLA
uniref:Hypothetical secreted protein 1512 n=1 Tax=Amblyomma variegatum TaxID=34610 RepID=F0J9W8_AMBVA|nr:TPA_inf: hypothetical secreted protein 1512 [Amblyomma variegatum]